MRVQRVEVQNFRGIEKCDIHFPEDNKIVILIGPGDSTKSTLLTAIQWNAWPSWNLQAIDTDFYQKKTQTDIIIRCTYTDVARELLSEDKYGLYLRKPDVEYDGESDDEPSDDEISLTVQLTIDSSLEPKWEVVCNRKEPKVISAKDRQKLNVCVIGNSAYADFQWGKNSVLQKYTQSREVLHDAYMKAVRHAANDADLSALDDVVESIEAIGKEYGVGFQNSITNKLIYQNASFSSSVGLFDGNVPLTQRGLGSRRLLSMGLNINVTNDNSILLIDEIESGLEPYRIKSLINQFRSKMNNNNHVIFTTHSPVVVSEAKLEDMLVIRSEQGITKASRFEATSATKDFIQKTVRSNAEAFLTKRLIVCEGKTEIGYIRALDNYLDMKYEERMAYHGVGTFLGGGESVLECAQLLQKCGYDVCVFMDSDKEEKEAEKTAARENNIPIFDWDKNNAIEDQLFLDSPEDVVQRFLDIAVSEKGIDSIKDSILGIQVDVDGENLVLKDYSLQTRKFLAETSKRKKQCWFKRIDLGEMLGDAVFANISKYDKTGKINSINNNLIEWIKKDNE